MDQYVAVRKQIFKEMELDVALETEKTKNQMVGTNILAELFHFTLSSCCPSLPDSFSAYFWGKCRLTENQGKKNSDSESKARRDRG